MSRDDYEGWSTPQITINNIVIDIVPNSFKFKKGVGEQSVKAASSGGNAVSLVIFENVETKIGEVKFQLFNTPANNRLFDTIKNNNPLNSIIASHPTQNIQYFFGNAVLVNDPEWTAGVDGMVDLEFKTRAAV